MSEPKYTYSFCVFTVIYAPLAQGRRNLTRTRTRIPSTASGSTIRARFICRLVYNSTKLHFMLHFPLRSSPFRLFVTFQLSLLYFLRLNWSLRVSRPGRHPQAQIQCCQCHASLPYLGRRRFLVLLSANSTVAGKSRQGIATVGISAYRESRPSGTMRQVIVFNPGSSAGSFCPCLTCISISTIVQAISSSFTPAARPIYLSVRVDCDFVSFPWVVLGCR